MPAVDTLLWFQPDLSIEHVWHLSGAHYERTANDWLHSQDTNSDALRHVI
jgi:cyclopropane-fatty-acyl-phospholipid synthase